jgi:hypothetical protein
MHLHVKYKTANLLEDDIHDNLGDTGVDSIFVAKKVKSTKEKNDKLTIIKIITSIL